jgi:hypothetical protein
MIQKNSYQAPHITVVHIQTANIIAATGQQSGGPSAGFMDNPGISGNGNGVRANRSVFDDDEDEDNE